MIQKRCFHVSFVWILTLALFGLLPGCASMGFDLTSEVTTTVEDRQPSGELDEDAIAEARARQKSWIEAARNTRDIIMGMNTQDVQAAWGSPTDIEWAGDPKHGNSRWIYRQGLSQGWGTGSNRVIYFESGQVAGWETLRN